MSYNTEQREVILHKDGPALVVAGPGSGKTAVLTARIEYLIRHYHIPPSQILVLSFTRAASREIEHRFQSRTGEKTVTFGTIHAVFYRILKISRPQTASLVIPSFVRRQFIREYLLEEAGWEEAAQEKIEQIEAALLRGEEDGPKPDPEECGIDLEAAGAFYERRKRENGLLDFTDILRDCLRFLESDEEARNWWRRRFRYVMVDEYQDVSPLQQRLLKLLTGPGGNLLAVGDEDQSIYAFRGSDSTSVLRFEREFPGAVRYTLVRCYRCSPQILRCARVLIAHNTKRFPKELISEAEPGEEPVRRVFTDHPSEMRAVAEEIRRSLGRDCEAKQIAVLARTRFSLRRMAAATQ